MPNLTQEQANEVYDILVSLAGAPNDSRHREMFVYHQQRGCPEYRICWALGFGGKFYNDSNGMRVGYYPEDQTPEREAIKDAVNEKLISLQKKWENLPGS